MESTEVLNIPVRHQDVIKSNDGHRKDVNTISDAKEEILISKNDEGKSMNTQTNVNLNYQCVQHYIVVHFHEYLFINIKISH